MERPDVYCQNCRSQNSLRDSHCRKCGTRLLLVVFPQSLQYDTNHTPSFYEDHLLERVSLLELRLVQMSESLRIAMEIMREQGKIVKENQHQVRQLKKRLENRPEIKTPEKKSETKNKLTRTIDSIVSEHDSPNVELFTKLLAESVKLLEQNEEKEAFRMLERAALLSPRNLALLLFAAKTHFFADKYTDAKKYLEKAFELAPDNTDVLFLLGVIYADEGDAEKARLFLSILAENEKTSFVVNFIWGILAAYEKKWSESVAAFKLAVERAESVEIEYLLGCAFYEQTDFSSALRHFQNAGLIDAGFSDVWFMQALVYRQLKDETLAAEMLDKASQLKEAGAQSAEFLRRKNLDPENALPFQHFRKVNTRILTGGALRLGRFLKSEALRAVED